MWLSYRTLTPDKYIFMLTFLVMYQITVCKILFDSSRVFLEFLFTDLAFVSGLLSILDVWQFGRSFFPLFELLLKRTKENLPMLTVAPRKSDRKVNSLTVDLLLNCLVN